MTETRNLAAALAALQAKMPEIRKTERADVKTQKGSDYSYTYAGLAAVSHAIMPLMGELGLSFIARPTFASDGKFVLAYSLLHSSGEREDGEYPLPTSGTPQTIGSAITYGRRYCLCAATGAAPEDDDDDAAAAQEEERQRVRPVAARSRRPQQPAESQPSAQTSRQQAPRAPAGAPPLPGEDESRPAQRRHVDNGGRGINRPGALAGLIVQHFERLGITDREERLILTGRIAGTEDIPASTSDLGHETQQRVLDFLSRQRDVSGLPMTGEAPGGQASDG